MAKSVKPFRPVAVTANDLRSGSVVYRGRDGAWTTEVAGADVAETPDAADRLLALAQADHDACQVVEPVLIEMAAAGGACRPATLRERIRSGGPTAGLPRPAEARS